LVVEVDGPIHENRGLEDSVRTEVLEERDLKVIRFTNRKVMNDMKGVLGMMLEGKEDA